MINLDGTELCRICNGLLYGEHSQCRKIVYWSRKYDVSVDMLKSLVMAHNGTCDICKRRADLHLDHDHQTGEIRGLLCISCNTGIGMLKDSPRLLAQALVYLEENGRELV